MTILYNILGAIFLGIGVTIIMSKFFNKKPPISKISVIIHLLILSICWLSNYYIIDNFSRLIISFSALTIIFRSMFKEAYARTIIVTFISYAIIIVSEAIYGLLTVYILDIPVKSFANTGLGMMITNLVIVIIGIALSFAFKHFIKYDFVISDKNGKKIMTTIILCLVFCMGFLLFRNFNNDIFQMKTFIDYLIMIIFCVSGWLIIKENKEKASILSEYDLLQEYVKTTEGVLEKYRLANHENKNQLIAIKSKVENKEVDTVDYIDELLKEEMPLEVEIINNLVAIPLGGLKGLMYHKICKMKQNGINVKVNIITSKHKHCKMPVPLSRDFFKIIGVYLDNAYEAAMDTASKEIIIEGYITKEQYSLLIINTYNSVDLSKIDNLGYTTKSNGHGYGLSLVKEIASRENRFLLSREVDEKYFYQHIDVNIN